MHLQDQCCTLQQAERLLSFGITIPGQFAFTTLAGVVTKNEACKGAYNWVAVYSSAELGNALPDDVRSYRLEDSWQVYYPAEEGMSLFISEDCDTEAQIRAAFLIWGLESGYIDLEDVKKRLST